MSKVLFGTGAIKEKTRRRKFGKEDVQRAEKAEEGKAGERE
jgi:hypothetical protein